MSYLYFIFGCILSGQAARANPQIDVGEMYDYLEGDKISIAKHIFNSGGGGALVRVELLEILYSVAGVPVEVHINDPRRSLMVVPKQFFVAAGESRIIRLAYFGGRNHERYFRVRVMPVIQEQASKFAAVESKYEVGEKALTAHINLLVGYGAVLFVRPTDTVFNTLINEDIQNYTIVNRGNSVVIVDAFIDCPRGERTRCKPAAKHHLLPGKDFQFEKQLGHEYRFTLIEGSNEKDLIVRG